MALNLQESATPKAGVDFPGLYCHPGTVDVWELYKTGPASHLGILEELGLLAESRNAGSSPNHFQTAFMLCRIASHIGVVVGCWSLKIRAWESWSYHLSPRWWHGQGRDTLLLTCSSPSVTGRRASPEVIQVGKLFQPLTCYHTLESRLCSSSNQHSGAEVDGRGVGEFKASLVYMVI